MLETAGLWAHMAKLKGKSECLAQLGLQAGLPPYLEYGCSVSSCQLHCGLMPAVC